MRRTLAGFDLDVYVTRGGPAFVLSRRHNYRGAGSSLKIKAAAISRPYEAETWLLTGKYLEAVSVIGLSQP